MPGPKSVLRASQRSSSSETGVAAVQIARHMQPRRATSGRCIWAVVAFTFQGRSALRKVTLYRGHRHLYLS